jgi:hypothetical protein
MLIERWEELPAVVRAGIVAMVDARTADALPRCYPQLRQDTMLFDIRVELVRAYFGFPSSSENP